MFVFVDIGYNNGGSCSGAAIVIGRVAEGCELLLGTQHEFNLVASSIDLACKVGA